MCTQHKLQRASLKILSELISTFGTFVHFDSKPPKGPFFNGPLRVRCAIWTFWHDFPLSYVMGEIALYRFRDIFASNLLRHLIAGV
jgi:hypothetical protein